MEITLQRQSLLLTRFYAVAPPRAPDAWRSDFKRLGRLLQQTD